MRKKKRDGGKKKGKGKGKGMKGKREGGRNERGKETPVVARHATVIYNPGKHTFINEGRKRRRKLYCR